jgi:hypothetical protein
MRSLGVYEVDLDSVAGLSIRPRFYLGQISVLRLEQHNPWSPWGSRRVKGHCNSFAFAIKVDNRSIILFPHILAPACRPYILRGEREFDVYDFSSDGQYCALMPSITRSSCPLSALVFCKLGDHHRVINAPD